ncbi:Zn-finger [Trachipleistophora hominis]|uniref:Zn-finger n=1 Tax=Trachipleistophora hominis TaxID=72359 RepID=L7JXA6_TRAHO|nr:Zn-finger [Trachipleistophora hominis]
MKNDKWKMCEDGESDGVVDDFMDGKCLRADDVPGRTSAQDVMCDSYSVVRTGVSGTKRNKKHGSTGGHIGGVSAAEERDIDKENVVNNGWSEQNDIIDRGLIDNNETGTENNLNFGQRDQSDVIQDAVKQQTGVLHGTHETYNNDKSDSSQEIHHSDDVDVPRNAVTGSDCRGDDSAVENIYCNESANLVSTDKGVRTNSMLLKHGYQDRKFSIIREMQSYTFNGISKYEIELFRYFLWKIHRRDINTHNVAAYEKKTENGTCNNLYRENWHLAIHESDREYKCNHCDFTYIYRKCLITHMKKRHPRK